MKEVDYRKLIPKDVQEQILDYKTRGITVQRIAHETELTRYVIEKLLLQIGKYVPDMRYKENRKKHILLDNIPKQPFSKDELDYGMDYPQYTIESLGFSERILFNKKEHEDLKQIR